MSSLILLVIVAAWAMVLVPMLLRRHEQVSESRSVDRFASAMQVLGRRASAVGDRRYVVVPRRPAVATQVVTNGTTQWRAPVTASRSQPTSPASVLAEARRTVLRRRRRTVAALAVLALAQAGAALLLGPGFWAGQAAADALLLGYLVHLRQEQRRSRTRTSARQARRVGEATVQPPASAASGSSPSPSPSAASTAPTTDAARGTSEVAWAGASSADPVAVAETVGDSGAEADPTWQPQRVPLPTYVTAPAARSRPNRQAAGANDDAAGPDAEVMLELGDVVDRREAAGG